MAQVLFNLANIHLIDYCKANGINCGGSHVEKSGRGFRYRLVRDDNGGIIASLRFSKSSRPVILPGYANGIPLLA